MRRAVLVPVVLASLVTACTDQTPITGVPDRASPSQLAIWDGSTGGNEFVHWLPPLVEQPPRSALGTFEAGLDITIAVFCHDTDDEVAFPNGNGCNGTLVREFTIGDGVVVESDHYKVELNTKDLGLVTSDSDKFTTYRIIALAPPLFELDPLPLAHADIQLAANGREARNLAQGGETIALVDGRVLPVRIHIDIRALGVAVKAATEDDPELDDLCQVNCSFTVIEPDEETIAELADEEGNVLTAARFEPGDVGEKAVLLIDERTDANCAVGEGLRKEDCFRYELTTNLVKPVHFGICPVALQEMGVWQQPLEFPMLWRILKHDDDERGLQRPEEVDVSDFLPCGFLFASSSFLGELSRYAARLLDQLVRPLYAADTRHWGAIAEDFSDVFWGLEAELVAVTDTEETTLKSGTTVPVTVRALSEHQKEDDPDAEVGVPGIEIVFLITEGAGVLAAAQGFTVEENSEIFDGADLIGITVLTDADGDATVDWTVGSGPNTLQATSPQAETADGEPIVFITEGGLPDLTITSGPLVVTPTQVAPGGQVTLSPWTVTNQGPVGIDNDIRNGFYLSTDPVITSGDVFLDRNNNTADVLGAGQSFDWGGPTLTVPTATMPGPYFIGILVDDLDEVLESDETNNYVSAPLGVTTGTQLLTCERGNGGDLLSRGFYIPSYPGFTLARIELYVSSRAQGEFELQVAAREGTYDGQLLGTARATTTLSGSDTDFQVVSFEFHVPIVDSGSTVTFALSLLSGPTNEVFYDTGLAPLGDGDAEFAGCPNVIQTNGSSAPLDTFRRAGVALNLFGDPVIN